MLPTQNCEMKFYYHMFGGDCGSLLVYINSGDSVKLVFNKTGEQGKDWLGASVQLKSDYAFRIHITATRGNSFKGDIAIDDISFRVREYIRMSKGKAKSVTSVGETALKFVSVTNLAFT